MTLFGRNSDVDIDIKHEYLQQQKGLASGFKSSKWNSISDLIE